MAETNPIIQEIVKQLGNQTFYEVLMLRNKMVDILVKMAMTNDKEAAETLRKIEGKSTVEQVALIYHGHPEMRKLKMKEVQD